MEKHKHNKLSFLIHFFLQELLIDLILKEKQLRVFPPPVGAEISIFSLL